jgi:hypothetical protein
MIEREREREREGETGIAAARWFCVFTRLKVSLSLVHP